MTKETCLLSMGGGEFETELSGGFQAGPRVRGGSASITCDSISVAVVEGGELLETVWL